MAENAANFYSTSDSQPSIFEIIAQKSLNTTLEPALQKVAELLGCANPTYCSWLSRYYNESFLVLNGVLQYYYLKKHGASFSEYFYGLKRVELDEYEISKLQMYLSWGSIVILPYLKRKLDDKIADYRLQEAECTLPQGKRGKLIKLLMFSHSTFEVTWGSWILMNYLRYMSKQTSSQLPILTLLKLKLVYSNVEDDFHTFWSALFRGKLSFSELSSGLVQNAVRSVLEISAFFVQFLQVWNSEKANFNVSALPPIPPPGLDPKSARYKEKCPICFQYWKIPCVLPVSGYVFCFPCILKHLKENGVCPVTNLPAKPLDIIRLY